MYSDTSVRMCVIISCEQVISKSNLWISPKFIEDTSYILRWKLLTSGANHTQDG